jgi:hypothetical protein
MLGMRTSRLASSLNMRLMTLTTEPTLDMMCIMGLGAQVKLSPCVSAPDPANALAV